VKTAIRPEAEMKDSNVQWIGNIPRDWYIRPLKSLYYLTTGFTPNSKDDALYDENGEVWVTIGDLKGSLVTDSKQKISAEVAKMHIKEMTKKGSLMYSFKLSVGTVAFAGKDLFTNEAIASLWPKNDLGNLNYLKYASSLIIGNANTNIYGAFIMNQQLILNAPLPVPMKNEQQAIADYLDEKCSKIDEIIAESKASIENYKELKQSVIFEAVTKGLDKNVDMKNSSIEGMGLIPEKWSIVRFMKTNYVRARLGWKGLKAEEYVDTGYPFLSAYHIVNNHLSWENLNYITAERYDESPEIKLSIGDLLLVKDGAGIGKCARIDDMPLGEATVNSSLSVITPNKSLDYRYVYYYFLSPLFQNIITRLKNGMGVPHLTQESMKDIYLPLPTKIEQKEIADFLDKKTSEIDSLISEKQSLILDLEAYKKSLIYEVVTGKRRVV